MIHQTVPEEADPRPLTRNELDVIAIEDPVQDVEEPSIKDEGNQRSIDDASGVRMPSEQDDDIDLVYDWKPPLDKRETELEGLTEEELDKKLWEEYDFLKEGPCRCGRLKNIFVCARRAKDSKYFLLDLSKTAHEKSRHLLEAENLYLVISLYPYGFKSYMCFKRSSEGWAAYIDEGDIHFHKELPKIGEKLLYIIYKIVDPEQPMNS
ncbi:unnamed protein product [Caenorhabditis auriculariae]|uniref:Uncharacterized protein n=1 Tax=Caenorhabditis auriculariae TaxID=2777116 RepID=A0A8S1H6L1_9PELO|nr:unnamed protein product [Caenorhabditis auriculariae]